MVPNRSQESIDEKELGDEQIDVQEKEHAQEQSGKLRKDNRDDKLLHSKINVDKDKVDKGKVLNDAINNNISSFTPDLAFEQMVNNYNNAKNILGPTLIRELTGYDPGYVEKNVKVPEFQREIKDKIKNNMDSLKDQGILNKEGNITDEGFILSTLAMISEELDKLEGEGYEGHYISKNKSSIGDPLETRPFKRGDAYKDLDVHKTVKRAIKRGRTKLEADDLMITDKESKGKMEVIYALDCSGSMKGNKVGMAKKAGIALSYNAIKNNDEAGLILFGSEILEEEAPGKDFYGLAMKLQKVKTKGETDISKSISSAMKLFSNKKVNKHLVILTDALQTRGSAPEKKVLESVSIASEQKITISVIGIGLNQKGETLAKKIVDISDGNLYKVADVSEVDRIVIEDYYNAKKSF